jgi:hypothetical protein
MRLFQVPLFDDESLTSFCSRFAAANARTAHEICQDFGFSFRQIVAGESDAIARLSELSGVDADSLDAAAVKRSGEKTVWVAGHPTPHLFHMRGVLKFCPMCFAEDDSRVDLRPKTRRHIRKTWYSRFVRTCVKHETSLVSAGTHGQPDFIHDLPWSLSNMRREVSVASKQTEAQQPSAFESYALARLRGHKPGNDFLDPLPLYVAGDICELAGLVALHGKAVTVSDKSDRDRWAAGAKGFEMFERGLPGFHEFLFDLFRQLKIVRADYGGNELFGKFHEVLANRKGDPAYEPVKEAARSYAFGNLPLTAGTLLFSKHGDAKYQSYNAIATKNGIPDRTLRKILQVTGRTQTIPGTDIPAVPAAEVDELVLMISDLVRATEAFKIMGITTTAFNNLVADGLIEPKFPANDDIELSARFSRAAIVEFRDGLLAKANTDETEGLKSVYKTSRTLALTFGTILKLIRDGNLTRVGIDKSVAGIMALMVDPDEVLEALAVAEPDVHNHTVGVYTVPEMAERLNATVNSVGALIRMDAIKVEIVRHPRNQMPTRVATLETLEAFEKRYVSLSRCCNWTGYHHGAVRQILQKAGVERVPAFADLREGFYFRAEAEAALGIGVGASHREPNSGSVQFN